MYKCRRIGRHPTYGASGLLEVNTDGAAILRLETFNNFIDQGIRQIVDETTLQVRCIGSWIRAVPTLLNLYVVARPH